MVYFCIREPALTDFNRVGEEIIVGCILRILDILIYLTLKLLQNDKTQDGANTDWQFSKSNLREFVNACYPILC